MLCSLNKLFELKIAFPDILSLCSLFILMFMQKIPPEKYIKTIFPKLSLSISIISLIIMLIYNSSAREISTDIFVYNNALGQIKILLLSCLCGFLIYLHYTKLDKILKTNFFIMIFGITTAITLAISANSLLTLLFALELYTFSVVFLLLHEGQPRCATRFLLISAVMDAVYIFGCSLLYSQYFTLSFSKINCSANVITNIGGILIMVALLFKLGCAPFHSWLSDVYDKSSRITVLFLEVIWKFFMLLIFIKLFYTVSILDRARPIILGASIISMFIGAIMPIIQKDINKFIASVTIGHIGFVLSIQTLQNSAPIMMTYMTYQSLATFCFLASIFAINKTHDIRTFEDLGGLYTTAPIFGFLTIFSLFAICGLPPFGNFYAKMDIFMLLLKNKNYFMLFISLIYSIISVGYLIKWGRLLFVSSRTENNLKKESCLFASSLIILLAVSLIFYNSICQFWGQIFRHII